MNNIILENNTKPYVKIIEEPCSRGLRFRYECEGRFAGSIRGINSISSKKSYPSIQIMNYTGPAVVVVSCVTKEAPYRPHPHNLVGKAKEISQGICSFKIKPDQTTIQFPNIGIQCMKKKDIDKSLTERERLQVDPFKTGFYHKTEPESIDLSSVRLCFQVFLEGQSKGTCNIPLEPVVSNPIYDKKAVTELSIWWVSHYTAPVTGGSVMCMLCEKIAKEDIQVRFYCEENKWEATAEFTPPKFHKQVAIIFKTPKFIMQEIDQPVRVQVQLKRPSDGETSKPIPFEFIPSEFDDENGFKMKRQKCSETPKDLVFRHLQAEADKNLTAEPGTNHFKIIQAEPWLPSAPIHPADMERYAQLPLFTQTTNNMNLISEEPSTSNYMATDFNQPYYYNIEQMQKINEAIENRWLSNDLIVKQQMSCQTNNCIEQPLQGTSSEPGQQQISADLDELLTSIIEYENFGV